MREQSVLTDEETVTEQGDGDSKEMVKEQVETVTARRRWQSGET